MTVCICGPLRHLYDISVQSDNRLDKNKKVKILIFCILVHMYAGTVIAFEF